MGKASGLVWGYSTPETDICAYEINEYCRQRVIVGNAQEWLELENAACRYEAELLPPFYGTLTQYVDMGNSTFACPGHQHGEFFRKHPAGRHFYDFFGENLFRADMCNADVKLGDLLIHEGSAKHAQKFAAKVFNADKTYFVLNGTSGRGDASLS